MTAESHPEPTRESRKDLGNGLHGILCTLETFRTPSPDPRPYQEMNYAPTATSRAGRIIAGFSILMVVVAFAYNGFLLYCIFDGKRLIDALERAAGRELSGYELFSEHREINSYFYPDRTLQGDILYWSSAISLPWAMVIWIAISLGGLVILLRLFWNSRQRRATGLGALAVMLYLLGAVISHLDLMKKIAWAID